MRRAPVPVEPLPEPDADARAHAARVRAAIDAAIDAHGGFLPLADYIGLALYAPGLGYYAAGARKFGRDGDFVTAPELTPLFGQALATQVDGDPRGEPRAHHRRARARAAVGSPSTSCARSIARTRCRRTT